MLPFIGLMGLHQEREEGKHNEEKAFELYLNNAGYCAVALVLAGGLIVILV